MFIRISLFIFLLLCASPITSAFAADRGTNAQHQTETIQYALTMHGAPALARDFDHYPYANPNAPLGGTLRQPVIGTFDTLNPFTMKGKPAQGHVYLFDRLMDRSWDEPFTLYPMIARGVQVTDDRSAITIYLNPDARFSDKTPITADDVLFSFNTFKEYGRPNMRRIYKLVNRVQVVDPLTIRFELGKNYDRETVMILSMMPVLSKSYWQDRDFEAAILDPHMVTSGPYIIDSLSPGQKIVYRRDPSYWGHHLPVRRGLNNIERLVFDYYRDEGIAFESFKSGGLDFRRETNIQQWRTGYNIPAVKRGDITLHTIPHHRAEMVRGLIMNTRNPLFEDIRVRKALSLAFDFEWVNKNLYTNQLKRTDSFFPNTDLSAPPVSAGSPSLPTSGTRPALLMADTLLKQAGWTIQNGIRVHKDTGKPLTFEILLGAPEEEKIALSFIQSLKKLGMSVRVRTLDAAAFRDRLNTYDFDMVSYNWIASLSPGGEQINNWGCMARNVTGGFNYAGICSKDIDRLAGQIAQAATRDDLRQMTQRLDRALLDGYYVIMWGHHPADLIALRRGYQFPAAIPLWGFVPETLWYALPPSAPSK